MHVALYARVSTPHQHQEGTMASQVQARTQDMHQQEWSLLPAHASLDAGLSGVRLERPGLERLRDAAQRGACDAVVILSPDRFARHDAPPWLLIAECETLHVHLIFLQHPCGDTPQGQLLTLGRVPEPCGLFDWTCPEPSAARDPDDYDFFNWGCRASFSPLVLPVGTPGLLPSRSPYLSAAYSSWGCGHSGTRYRSTSRSVHTRSVSPAAMAGVHGRHCLVEPVPLVGTGCGNGWRTLACGRQKL